jgi:dehydrogenase/reductase SDR family member 7B
MQYKGKRAWITGASSGIGQALAEELATRGTHLVISGRDTAKLEVLAQDLGRYGVEVLVVPFDIADSKQIEEAAEKVKKSVLSLDMVILNAGISQRSFAKDTPVEIDRRIMEVDYFGHVIMTKSILPFLIDGGGGHLVVISSVTGKFGFPMRSAYSAAKHALHGFFESLRAEMVNERVRVTMVCPGRIRTSISLHALDQDGRPHGKMDEGQEKGMPASTCARKILRAVSRGKKEIWIGRKESILIFFRLYLPGLFYYISSRIKPT